LDELFASQSIQITERLVAPSIRKRRPWTRQQKVWTALVAGGIAFVLLLLGVILKMKTSEGTLVVEISEPDATVQVLNEQGTVLIERKGQKETLTIGVDPGKRRLQVEKDGFKVFAKEFSIAAGGKEAIKAKLEPVVATQGKDLDREAAEWVLAKGGTLSVTVEGQNREIKALAELPKEGFKVASISLSGNKSVGDDVFTHVKGLTDLRRLSLQDTQVTGQGLEQLESVETLAYLEISGTGANDATLGHLRELKRLTNLDVARTAVTDVGLGHLEGLDLVTLLLDGTQVSDAGLKHLRRMKSLRYLTLVGTQVTDEGLIHLEGLESLEFLYFNGTKVTDAGLRHLTGLTKLKALQLTGLPISDAGLEHLRGMKKLVYIGVGSTRVTDQGLQSLKGLQGLTELLLEGTQVTATGVAALQAALPKCKITVSPEVQAELDKLMKPSPATAATDPNRVPPPPSKTITEVLQHFDTDVADDSGKAWTRNGNVAVSSAQAKFGAKSLYIPDGTSNLQHAYDANLNFGTEDFTVEAFVWLPSAMVRGVYDFFAPNSGGVGRLSVRFIILNDRMYAAILNSDGTVFHDGPMGTGTIPTNQWSHIAWVRYGSTFMAYIDGRMVYGGSVGGIGDVKNYNTVTRLAETIESSWSGAYIDEFRVSKGIARYTYCFVYSTRCSIQVIGNAVPSL
jgi:hypothetical protein